MSETEDDQGVTRRNFIATTVAAAMGTSTGGNETPSVTEEPETEGKSDRVSRLRHEFEEYVDSTSRDRLWRSFGFSPDFDTITTRSGTGNIQLVTYDEDSGETVNHVLGHATGYDEDEQAYIASKAEDIGELYKSNPDIYASTGEDPEMEEVARTNPVEDQHITPAERKEIDEEVRERMDQESRQNLWTYFSDHPGAEEVSVQQIGDNGYQLTIEEDKSGRNPVSVYGLDQVTGFDEEEQAYVSENIGKLHALYTSDQTLYLDEADDT